MKIKFFINETETSPLDYQIQRQAYGYVEKIETIGDEQHRSLIYDEPIYKQNQLRKKRDILLRLGFDPWEKAMLAGRETNDPLVYQWYEDLLDIEKTKNALENIPERVGYYLGGK